MAGGADEEVLAPAAPPVPSDLDAAVDFLLGSATQATTRLNALADYLVDHLAEGGLPGVRGGSKGEVTVPGFGRSKTWDISFVSGGRPRLLVSLKSILKNISGTVPNRIDDLMGEAANIQLLFPEVVIGYVAILDEAVNAPRTGGGTWVDFFSARVEALAVRKAPVWGAGLIEAVWVIRIDSRRAPGARLLDRDGERARGEVFITSILKALRMREPHLLTP